MVQRSDGSSFRRLVIRAAVLPILLLVALAGVLVTQIQSLLTSASLVEHSDQVIANGNRLLRFYIDMETGVRGYVITRDRAFLEPFDLGLAGMEPLVEATQDLVADRGDQTQRLAKIEESGRAWIAQAHEEIATPNASRDAKTIDGVRARKALMDSIRGQFDQFIGAEERLRAARGQDAHRAAGRGVWIAGGATLLVGLVLAGLSRREFLGLAKTYESAIQRAEATTAELERRVAERTETLRRTNGSLTEANQELEAFAYSISHDLRAPLRHIGGFSELLRLSLGTGLSTDDAENLATITDTAKLAGRMVDDLLSFSRIGRAELRQEPVDLDELITKCRRELAPETRGREIEWKITPLPPTVGDAPLLKLAISNLLSNALKYTAKGATATIEIGSIAESDSATTYFVRDNGVGFDMTYAHKLFGVFQRLHRAEEYEGTGIGLANVRRIIVRHGGRVWAEGRPNEGATFFFSLPIGA